MSKTDKKKDKR